MKLVKPSILKNYLIPLLLICSLTSNLFAGNVYVAPSISYQGITARAGEIRFIGYTPSIALGYGEAVTDWLYLAGEFFGSTATIKYDDSTENTIDSSIRPQYSVGASFLPGFILDSVLMAYLRLGAISTRFKSYDKTKGGYQIGGGLEMAYCSPWTVRAEYVYTGYSSISGISTPKMDEYRLALVYRFS